MKLKPGCGCLVLILAVSNLLLGILALYGLVSGTVAASPMSVSFALVFFANAVICPILGVSVVRRGRTKVPVSMDTEEIADGDEGTDMDEER